MKLTLKILSVCYLVLALSSCKKEDDLNTSLPPSLGGDTWKKGPIDQWLYDSITKPYNIEVKYRWDPWEVDLAATLVPPDESVVLPLMSVIKQVWIDPYNAETGSDDFLKKYSPKEFVLVGSPKYLPNGTINLGVAEGGNRITILDVNSFDKTNLYYTRLYLHIIDHEFTHILNQNVLYPIEYKSITGGYTATWFNISEAQAHEQGFISAYAMAAPDEDFAEQTSLMLTEGKNRYEELIASVNSATGRAALRRKEEIVVTYFKQAYNIDFYSLQQRTQAALNKVSPDPIENYFGWDKPYTTVSVNPANTLLTQGAGFTTIYNNTKTGLAASGGVLDSMAVTFNAASTMQLRVYYHTTSANTQANFTYNVSKVATGMYTFSYVGADAAGGAISAGVAPLINYFNNNNFKVTWYLSPNNTINPLRVVFTPQQTANASFMGLLLK